MLFTLETPNFSTLEYAGPCWSIYRCAWITFKKKLYDQNFRAHDRININSTIITIALTIIVAHTTRIMPGESIF